MFRFLYCNIIKEERRCRLKDVFYHHSDDSHIKNTGTYLISTKPPLLMVIQVLTGQEKAAEGLLTAEKKAYLREHVIMTKQRTYCDGIINSKYTYVHIIPMNMNIPMIGILPLDPVWISL